MTHTNHGDMICEDCMLPLRECQCENWHGTDGDDETEDTGPHAHDAFTYCGECGEKIWLTGDHPAHVCDPVTLRKRDEYEHPELRQHPTAICPVCGREMEWEHYDDETDEDIFHCLTEGCPVGDDMPIKRGSMADYFARTDKPICQDDYEYMTKEV